MEGSVEDLVDQLYRLFTGGDKTGVVSSDTELGTEPIVPSQLFAIIDDVLAALTPEECARQREMALAHLIQDVQKEPTADTPSQKPETAASTAASRLCVTILTSSALLTPALVAGQKPITPDVSRAAAAAAASATTSATAASHIRAWEQCALHIFAANPPFPEHVIECAAYGAARLTLQQWALSEKLVLAAACEAVQRLAPTDASSAGPPLVCFRAGSASQATAAAAAATASTTVASGHIALDINVAVEVLAQVTALLALDRPLSLSGVTPPPVSSSASGSGAAKGGASSRKGQGKNATTATESASAATTGATAVNPFSQSLGLTDATVHEVREGIIRAALYALGGAAATLPTGTATSSASAEETTPSGSTHRALTGRRDQVLSSLLCRRVLIPLLLLNGDDTLLTFEPLVQQLLCTLGGDCGSGGTVSGTETELAAPPQRSTEAEEERRGEVVVLTAALFDFLFRTPDLTPENDYRFSPFLWRTLHGALYDAIATSHIDAGRRANMQLRVEYLLKRIVDLTHAQEAGSNASAAKSRVPTQPLPQLATPLPPVITFNPDLFVWCTVEPSDAETSKGKAKAKASTRAVDTTPSSARSWGYFFLVLEALNEFGWHIIQPALVKLDALVLEFQAALEAPPSTSTSPLVTPLASAWIELLHLKLILHPNLGVRKVGLRRVWALPASVLATFSHAFLFTHVLESATDPRLCVELDRTPITATFLETKAFEGQEVCAVPDLEPLAHEVERFYAHLFLHQLTSAHLRTVAMRRMLRSLLQKPPRFTVSVAVRTLHYLAQQLLVQEASQPERQAWTQAMMLDDEVLASLGIFLRDSIQENIPFWLDVRVTAILFSTFLHFAALAPRVFRLDTRYWRLMCLCGPLGQSGGKSIARMDACGSSYGCVGSSLDVAFLHAKVAHFVSAELPAAYAPTQAAKAQFLTDLLLLDTLPERTRALLASSSSSSSASAAAESATFDELAVKQHFFLLGAPLAFQALTGAEPRPCWLAEVCAMVSESLRSLRARVYLPINTMLTTVACLVALEQTLSPRHAVAYFESDVLREMLETVRGHAMHALEVAHARMVTVQSADELSGQSTAQELALTDADATDVLESWQLMQTDVWDVLTSGVTSLHKLSAQRVINSLTPAALSNADIADLADGNNFGAAEAAQRLVPLVESCGLIFATTAAANTANTTADERAASTQADLARQAAQLVVARNTSRLLLSELCGLLFTEVDDIIKDEDAQVDGAEQTNKTAASTTPGLDNTSGIRYALPSSVEGSLRRLRTAVPGLSASVIAQLVTTLTKTLTQRLTTSALPAVLSGLPWPTLLAQHSRAVYNTIYILAEGLSPVASPHTTDTNARCPREPTLADVERTIARESLVPKLESFAMEQLERCWSSCLPSVMDLLVCVTSTHDPRVDYVGIVDAVFAHVHDVGARQHARASALAFTVLLFALPHAPRHVSDVLMRTLKSDVDATDRNVYFVAITACLGVLQNPANRYDDLLDVLVQCAVLYNSGRDEEENESTMATTEPLLQSWPEALRTRYPPTVRLSAVGRAFALSTLLWCCARDPEQVRPVELTMRLLRMNTEDPIVTHEPCMPNSQTHRTRLRLWQLLCALLPTLPSGDLDKVAPLFQVLLDDCVPINNMGSVRRFMELFAIRLLEAQPSLYTLVADALGDYSLRPQVCGTFVLVASHALLHNQKSLPPAQPARVQSLSASSSGGEDDAAAVIESGRTPLFNALFPRLLQQSTSNQHLLRIISHIGVYVVCQARLASGRAIPAEATAVFDYIARAPEHVKLREKHQEMLFFDTKEASTPRNLFCVQRKEANTILQEHIPAAAFERIRFLETEVDCLIGAAQPMEMLRVRLLSESANTAALLDRFRDFPLIPHTRRRADYYVDYTAEATRMLVTDPLAAASPDLSAANAGDDVQKKVTSWWNSAVYDELHPRAVQRQTRQSIVIVGSLLENPVNIAGLCRCGEIFAVERITIPEKKVFDHPHFVATARSAELWIPWQEVSPKDLPTYLAAMREDGYVIVGIEQTASSVSIADFSFPERVVVVLGAEGQGVPAPLIPLLDVCVEIPQYGLIRSLNVHVTGAITMFEYTRQHLMTTTTAPAAP